MPAPSETWWVSDVFAFPEGSSSLILTSITAEMSGFSYVTQNSFLLLSHVLNEATNCGLIPTSQLNGSRDCWVFKDSSLWIPWPWLPSLFLLSQHNRVFVTGETACWSPEEQACCFYTMWSQWLPGVTERLGLQGKLFPQLERDFWFSAKGRRTF